MKAKYFQKLNKGLTLVELLVAIAILSIVLLWVAHFMVTSSGLFKDENSKASVQNEVQFASTQITDLVKATQLGLSYTADSAYLTNDTGVDAAEKVLYIFNLNQNTQLVDVTLIKWIKSEKKIYLADVPGVANKTKIDDTSTTVSQTVLEAVGSEFTTWELLSEHIDSFNVDMSSFGAQNTITVKVSSKRIKKTYNASSTTKVRNNIVLNATNISELYDLSDVIVSTVIKSVSVNPQNNTTVPGGKILISTLVSGEGFPAQTIYKWKIVKMNGSTEGEVLYDSLSGNSSDTYIDTSSGILNVSESVNAQIIRVYAYVSTRSTEADFVMRTVKDTSKIENAYYSGGELKTILIYDYCDIAIREITSFTIKPNADLTLGANATLKALTNSFDAVTVYGVSEVINPGSMDVYPGNIIQMTSSILGNNLTTSDKSVYWTLESLNAGVIATISNGGLLMIDKYSDGGRCIVSCHSVLDTRLSLSYYVNIGNAFAEGSNILEVKCPEKLNRGSTTQLQLFMNGSEVPKVEFSNFIWTLVLKDSTGKEITNNAVSLDSTGKLSIASNLSYAYTFNLTIRVSLKSNNTIYVNKPVTIPKISISLNNKSYISKSNATIDTGEIKAIVVGLETGLYNLTWSIASETNPNYYLSSYANGTHVTSSNGNSCIVVLNESTTITYVRLKVSISGHTNYSAVCKIILRDVNFEVAINKSTIKRSSNTNVVTLTPASTNFAGFNSNEVEWSIGDVKCDGTIINDKVGIVLEQTSTGARMYAKLSFHYSTKNITVDIVAKWAGKSITKTITVTGVVFSIEGPSEITKGGSADYSVTHTNVTVTKVNWTYTYSKGDTTGIVLTPSTTDIYSCNLSLSKTFKYPMGGATITLTATVPGQDIVVTKTITLQPYSSGSDLEDDPFNNY